MSFLEKTQENYDVFYSRFFLHAIERSLLKKVIKHSKGLFIAEARSVLDASFVKDHKRNPISSDNLIKELRLNDFSVRYIQESRGLAIYKDQDPIIVRVIAIHNDKKTK